MLIKVSESKKGLILYDPSYMKYMEKSVSLNKMVLDVSDIFKQKYQIDSWIYETRVQEKDVDRDKLADR
jgi:hypothetical protein